MDSPSAYIPADRRQAMARDELLPYHTHGAALFADISGFTPLTDGLVTALGPRRGAEELLHHLNAVYDAVIAEVHRQRGSVVGFSGDAITCWFDGDDGRRAAACGLAQQQVMRQFARLAIPGGVVALALKVAVAVGPACRFLVGDPAIQVIDVLAGSTLDAMAGCEHLALKGEVVLNSDAALALAQHVRGGAWREDPESGLRCVVIEDVRQDSAVVPWTHLISDGLTDEQTRPWLLPQISERLQAGQGDFLAELRPAVSLFARFQGGDFEEDDTAGARLDTYVRWVQQVLRSHGGNLIQVTVGDKGTYLYAAFGAPVAHDDDAARAVAAALDLRAGTPGGGGTIAVHGQAIPTVQIGISRGRMRVGACGSATCRTYAVMGPETNMAARLMTRATPGEVLISEQIADVVGHAFQLDMLGPIQVKGRDAPLVVSRVVRKNVNGRASVTAPDRSLVGREAEIARMMEILQQTIEGAGHLLRIEGAAGIGKSHLAAVLAAGAWERGMRVATGASQSNSQETAYAPWRQILSGLLGLDEGEQGADPATTARQIAALGRLATATNPDWLLRLPLLGDLLGLPIPDNATTAAFEPKLRQSALFDLVVEMVRRWAGDQPLLLLIDDVHWIDEASAALALVIARGLATVPVVLAVVHRPPSTDQSILPELEALPRYHKVEVRELGPAGVATLMAARLGSPPALVASGLIAAVTQGNPFFVEELVDNLRESGGLLQRDDGHWWLSEKLFSALKKAGCLAHREGTWTLAPDASLAAADLGLPDSVHGMVLARMDRLPENAKFTLKVASVIGATFELEVLALAHPLHPSVDDLATQITVLERRDFAHTQAAGERYTFRHNVTREVAYETLLYTQRRQLHGAVGSALEQLMPDATSQLAHHFYAAEEWPRALNYQMEAGRQGQHLFANFDAVEYFARALHSADHLPVDETAEQRQEIYGALGELLTTVGRYDEARDNLQHALDLARSLGDDSAQVRACRWVARLWELRGDYSAAQEWIQQALAVLAGRRAPDAVEVLITGGLIHTRHGSYNQALERCQEALHMAQDLGDPMVIARAFGLLGIITQRRGNGAQAIEFQQQALEQYRQAHNVHGQALVHNEMANAHFSLGHWPEAVENYRHARAIFQQIGDLYNVIFADNNLGNIARTQGRIEDALAFFEEGLRSLGRIGGAPYVVGCFHMNLGSTYLRRGDVSAARRHLEASKDYYTQAQARDFLPELHRLFAEAALLQGAIEEAHTESLLSLQIARELAMRGEEGSTIRVLGLVAELRGTLDDAAEHLHKSVAILTEVGDEYEMARSWASLGRVSVAQGNTAAARDALRVATAIFTRLDATLDLAANRELEDLLGAAR